MNNDDNSKLTLATYLKRRGPVKALTRIEAESFGVPYPQPKGWASTYGETEITADMITQLRAKIERASPATAAKARRGLECVADLGDPVRSSKASNASSAPAAPALEVPATMPRLYRREVYAGVCVGADLVARHLILLPGDVHVGSIEDADEFVDSVGGDLQTYAELQYLHKHMSHLFKPSLYYSCDQEDYDGDMATALFDFAHNIAPDERDEPRQVRVRAVRRVLADADDGRVGGINAHQVAALAARLIDQYTVTDGAESVESARMVSTGIMVGVRLMATGVQKALAALARPSNGGGQ